VNVQEMMAGAHGFEPRSSELEADILPLKYAPNWHRLPESNRRDRIHNPAPDHSAKSALVPVIRVERTTDADYDSAALPTELHREEI
jgi:hypothetical protein